MDLSHLHGNYVRTRLPKRGLLGLSALLTQQKEHSEKQLETETTSSKQFLILQGLSLDRREIASNMFQSHLPTQP